VISSAIFGAVVIMVIITTLITPIALKWSLAEESGEQEGGLKWQQKGPAQGGHSPKTARTANWFRR
jgi:hypothetical protein